MAVGSVRSCGATTLALALAATWPEDQRRVLLVELDPAGGTLAGASGWLSEPSVVSLAAAARHSGDPKLIRGHCQALPGGAAVLAAPASAEQTRAALTTLETLIGRLGELDADVLADCGRLDSASPALAVWERADRVVLVARPRLADLHAAARWLEAHPLEATRACLVAVGDGPYPDAEIADAFGVEVAARLPWDVEAAEALLALPASARQLRLAPLVRASRTLAERLAADATGGRVGEPEPAAVKTRARLGRRVLAPRRTQPVAMSANGRSPEATAP